VINPNNPDRSQGMQRPFNEDSAVEEEVRRFNDAFTVTNVVETGTFYGVTTAFLASTFKAATVHTIELNKALCEQAKAKLEPMGVKCYHGSSSTVLKRILPEIAAQPGYCLFYLDAHGCGREDCVCECPILEELKLIGEHLQNKALIVIDDFKVPQIADRAEYQYDTWFVSVDDGKGGQTRAPLNIDLVDKPLRQCFKGDSPIIYYNDRSTRPKQPVGKLYALPNNHRANNFCKYHHGAYRSTI
jgi:hypothetical protein